MKKFAKFDRVHVALTLRDENFKTHCLTFTFKICKVPSILLNANASYTSVVPCYISLSELQTARAGSR